MCNRDRAVKAFMAVLAVLACTAFALPGIGKDRPECKTPPRSGEVLPPWENPHGYSLWDMAEETAAYNEDPSEPLPEVPFEVLVGGIADYTVRPGTMLYVPVYYADNAPPVLAGFPKDIRDQDADADFLASTALAAYDVTAFFVQVDGKTTVLCDDYTVGVKTKELPDGATDYIVSAAFLAPLTPGEHTVGIGGMIGGEPVVFVSYSVTVER